MISKSAAAMVLAIAPLVLATATIVNAAELKVIGSTGVRGVVSDLSRQFEAATSNKVITDFQVFAGLKRRIDAGEAFDIAILSPALIDDYIKQSKMAADSRTDFARSGMGLAMRKGAPKPDIGSVETLKRTLLNAQSVSYSKEGASGVYFLSLLDRLGITEAMKSKIKPYDRGLVEGVVAGEAEFVVTSLSTILAVPEAELVGPVPGEVQHYVVFTAGMSAASKQPDAARSLLKFFTAPASVPVLKAKGLEPGA